MLNCQIDLLAHQMTHSGFLLMRNFKRIGKFSHFFMWSNLLIFISTLWPLYSVATPHSIFPVAGEWMQDCCGRQQTRGKPRVPSGRGGWPPRCTPAPSWCWRGCSSCRRGWVTAVGRCCNILLILLPDPSPIQYNVIWSSCKPRVLRMRQWTINWW